MGLLQKMTVCLLLVSLFGGGKGALNDGDDDDLEVFMRFLEEIGNREEANAKTMIPDRHQKETRPEIIPQHSNHEHNNVIPKPNPNNDINDADLDKDLDKLIDYLTSKLSANEDKHDAGKKPPKPKDKQTQINKITASNQDQTVVDSNGKGIANTDEQDNNKVISVQEEEDNDGHVDDNDGGGDDGNDNDDDDDNDGGDDDNNDDDNGNVDDNDGGGDDDNDEDGIEIGEDSSGDSSNSLADELRELSDLSVFKRRSRSRYRSRYRSGTRARVRVRHSVGVPSTRTRVRVRHSVGVPSTRTRVRVRHGGGSVYHRPVVVGQYNRRRPYYNSTTGVVSLTSIILSTVLAGLLLIYSFCN